MFGKRSNAVEPPTPPRVTVELVDKDSFVRPERERYLAVGEQIEAARKEFEDLEAQMRAECERQAREGVEPGRISALRDRIEVLGTSIKLLNEDARAAERALEEKIEQWRKHEMREFRGRFEKALAAHVEDGLRFQQSAERVFELHEEANARFGPRQRVAPNGTWYFHIARDPSSGRDPVEVLRKIAEGVSKSPLE